LLWISTGMKRFSSTVKLYLQTYASNVSNDIGGFFYSLSKKIGITKEVQFISQ
jgi:hypothetical protein